MDENTATWRDLCVDRRAVTSLEYAAIAATVAAVALLGFGSLMTRLSTKVNAVGAKLT